MIHDMICDILYLICHDVTHDMTRRNSLINTCYMVYCVIAWHERTSTMLCRGRLWLSLIHHRYVEHGEMNSDVMRYQTMRYYTIGNDMLWCDAVGYCTTYSIGRDCLVARGRSEASLVCLVRSGSYNCDVQWYDYDMLWHGINEHGTIQLSTIRHRHIYHVILA